jgi:hypothetical protein
MTGRGSEAGLIPPVARSQPSLPVSAVRQPFRVGPHYQQRFGEIVTAYNAEKDETTFEALMKLVGELDEEATRAMREGLDEETLALFDLLKKDDLGKSDIERLKKVAVNHKAASGGDIRVQPDARPTVCRREAGCFGDASVGWGDVRRRPPLQSRAHQWWRRSARTGGEPSDRSGTCQ